MAELVEMILAQLIGNISTALIVVIFYFNFLLFENYLRLIVWAILFSQALRQAKNNVVSVLQYLSDDPDVDKYGFLTCVFSKSCEIFFKHPHDGSRRTAKELFLNYGIFLFSLIGAVSIWLRMYSWMSFLNLAIGFWIVMLSLIKILDRRIFYYRYFISDEVLVSMLLILGFFATGIFVVLYLGTESYLEGSRAASDLSDWIQKNFINDERTRQMWSEQVSNSRAMVSTALSGIENTYNDTMWWPPLKSVVKSYYLDSKAGDGNSTSQVSLYSRFSLPENMTLIEAVTFAYAKVDSVNLTSVQLTDWTSKGLEVSSIAFGSVVQLILLLVTLLFAFVSMGIRAFFFISSLFYLLCTKWDPIERFVEDLLPIAVDKRPDIVRSLRKVVEGVFFLPLKMSSIHAIVTLVSFTIVNADFMYLATTFTFFISIVPIIPPYLVCVPWVISIGITSSVVKAIALFGVQYFAFTVLDDMLYEKSIVALNSYVSALSVVFGVYVFGFEGVIFGPLSVCGVSFAYEVSNHGIQAAQDDGRNADESKTDSLEEESELEESQSAGSSFEDDETKKDDADSGASNYFSNAMYRVISGPLVDRVRRRFSIDITTEDSVCVTFVIEGLKAPKKVRFVANKTWSSKTLYDSIRRMLRVQSVEGIFTTDGTEVLSPRHMIPNETLHVRVRAKIRPSIYTDPSSHSESHARVSFAGHNASPKFRRTHSMAPAVSGYDLGMDSSSTDYDSTIATTSPPLPEKKTRRSLAGGVSVTVSGSRTRSRLRRQLSVPAQDETSQRRNSFTGGTQNSVSSPTSARTAATYEDLPRTLLHRISSVSSNASSGSFTESPSLFLTAREGMPLTNGDVVYTTPKKADTSVENLGAPSSTEKYQTPDALPLSSHRASAQPSPEASPDEGAIDATTAPNIDNGKKNVVGRQKKLTKAMKGTKLLFSPMAALQTNSKQMSYPSDGEKELTKIFHNEEAFDETHMEPSFIATPYVQTSSPSSRQIRAVLDAQEAEYLNWRSSRKSVKHSFASAKLNSPVRVIRKVEKAAAIPLWMTLSNQAKDAKTESMKDAVSTTQKSVAAPDQDRRSSTANLRSASLKIVAEDAAIISRSRLGSTSSPSLPDISVAHKATQSKSASKQVRLTGFPSNLDGTSRLRTPHLAKKRLQEHLYDFHSRQVFSYAASPGDEQYDDHQPTFTASTQSMEKMEEKRDVDILNISAARKKSILKPANDFREETCILEGVSFMYAHNYARIFDHDWKSSDVDKVVRDAVERKRIYTILKGSYRVLLWFFRYYAEKAALANGAAHTPDLYQLPSKTKLLEDLNVQCVDPAKYGITDSPLRREGLVGFLLSVAKMYSTHSQNPARARVLVAEGIEMSDAVTTLVRDHFGVYAQIQDVNHFRFVFLRDTSRPSTKLRQSQGIQEILTKHKSNLQNFFLEMVKGIPVGAGSGDVNNGSALQCLTMKFAQFLSALRSIKLIFKPKSQSVTTFHGGSEANASNGIEEGRALRVFLSCLGMSELDTTGREPGISTKELTYEQFVEALLRVALMRKELAVCQGAYDVCPGQLTSELCHCNPDSMRYNFDAFNDAVDELFMLIHAHRLKQSQKRSYAKMASLRSIQISSKQNATLKNNLQQCGTQVEVVDE